MAKTMLVKRLAALSSKISKTKSLLAKKSKAPFQRGVMQREVGKNVYKNVLLPSKFDTAKSNIGQHIKKNKGRYTVGAVAGSSAVAGGLKYQKVRRSRKER